MNSSCRILSKGPGVFRALARWTEQHDKRIVSCYWSNRWADVNPQPIQMLSRTMATQVKSRKLDISGMFVPITTPFLEDESIGWDKLAENIQKWNQVSLRGYVVQGSNGEFAYLSADERVEMVRFVAKQSPADKMIVAGSGCESTKSTIDMTRKMAEAGAVAALVYTPCFYKGSMTNNAMIQHFTKVADSSPIPIILYSVPANTGIDLAPEVVINLSSHPNIIGLKDSGGDISKIGNLVFNTKDEDFQILAGSAGFLLAAYTVGCVGGVCALGNVLGGELCKLEKLYKAGNVEEAKSLQHRLIAPNACVTRQYGVAGLKRAMEWFGYYGGPARTPIVPLSADQEKHIKDVFQKSAYEIP